MSKRTFQFAFLMFSVYFFYKSLDSVPHAQDSGRFECESACFRVLELSDPALHVTAANIVSFGLLRDGCHLLQANTVTSANSSVCVRYSAQVQANGYYFVTDGALSKNPARWTVEASSSDVTSVTQVGASEWILLGDGTVEYFPQLRSEMPLEQEYQHAVDYRLSWPWMFDWIVSDLIDGLCFLCCVILAVIGKTEIVKQVWLLMYSLGLAVIGVASLGYGTANQYRSAISCFLELPPMLIFNVGILFWEVQIIRLMLLCSFSYVVCLMITSVLVYGESGYNAIESVIQSAGTVVFLFAVVISIYRRRILQRSRKMIFGDQSQYDQTWSKILCENSAALQQLFRIEQESIVLLQGNPICRQCNRQSSCDEVQQVHINKNFPSKLYSKIAEAFALEKGTGNKNTVSSKLDTSYWKAGTQDHKRPIDSLEQLFVQASCLHPILLEKVKGWALASNGCFPLLESKSFVRYAESLTSPTLRFRWAKVKSVSRALEKVHRIYGQASESATFNAVEMALNLNALWIS